MPKRTPKSSRPQVAIYHDKGVWPSGRTAIESWLSAQQIDWVEICADEVNDEGLEQTDSFWLPGGWSGDYEERITPVGMENIRQFVRQGGRFVGICAGAFFASALITWEGESFDYPAGLFAGQTVGPVASIAPWPQHAMTSIELDPRHPINAALTTPRRQLYYGGPFFVPNGSQQVDIVAKYAENGQPAAITFPYGA
ncbi:MAG: hypothetical protein JXA42_00505, partial [Anaerolineales bacterium]|nr:hypothetical protein [Anaerolineales bacterium]